MTAGAGRDAAAARGAVDAAALYAALVAGEPKLRLHNELYAPALGTGPLVRIDNRRASFSLQPPSGADPLVLSGTLLRDPTHRVLVGTHSDAVEGFGVSGAGFRFRYLDPDRATGRFELRIDLAEGASRLAPIDCFVQVWSAPGPAFVALDDIAIEAPAEERRFTVDPRIAIFGSCVSRDAFELAGAPPRARVLRALVRREHHGPSAERPRGGRSLRQPQRLPAARGAL